MIAAPTFSTGGKVAQSFVSGCAVDPHYANSYNNFIADKYTIFTRTIGIALRRVAFTSISTSHQELLGCLYVHYLLLPKGRVGRAAHIHTNANPHKRLHFRVFKR